MNKNLLKTTTVLCSIFLSGSVLAETVVDETKTGSNGGTVNVQVDQYSDGEGALTVNATGKNGNSVYKRVDSEGYNDKVITFGEKNSSIYVSTDPDGNKEIDMPKNNTVKIVPEESVTVYEGQGGDLAPVAEVSKNQDGGVDVTKNHQTTTITQNEDGSVTATGSNGTATRNGNTTTVTAGQGETAKTTSFDNSKKPSRPRRSR